MRSLKKIAKQYMFHGSFFFDFIAVLPFDSFMPSDNGGNSAIINKIFRMVRITRLMKLLDIARFNHSLKSFFENDSSQDKIMLQYTIIHVFKIFRLFLTAIIITYLCGCIWFLIVKDFKEEGTKDKHGHWLT